MRRASKNINSIIKTVSQIKFLEANAIRVKKLKHVQLETSCDNVSDILMFCNRLLKVEIGKGIEIEIEWK